MIRVQLAVVVIKFVSIENPRSDAMQRPLVGKLLKVGLLFELANIIRINKINRRDKYAVVQWITPGCELLSDVDYAGPGILYEVTKVLNPSQA